MRLRSIRNRYVMVIVLIILGFIYRRRPLMIAYNIYSAWRGPTYRIVVFGDDWSDTGSYRISPPPLLSNTVRDPDRGTTWTEVLCKEASLNTDWVNNY